MTILIKGMDMPKKAYKDIHGTLWSNGRFTLTESNNTISDYEAVEVPTPHGRLIDADALMGLYEPAPEDVNEWEHYTTTISVIRKNIKDQPTVMEAEEG